MPFILSAPKIPNNSDNKCERAFIGPLAQQVSDSPPTYWADGPHLTFSTQINVSNSNRELLPSK
jgi:hypothetical protein